MASYNIAFIGTGGRSVCYGSYLAQCPDLHIVALADPSAAHRQTMQEKSGITSRPAQYDDWRELLRQHQDLHGVVICSPNYFHPDQAIACLERGLPIALEKPVAITQGDCERIIAAERANQGRSLIGFVLRSSPFYSKLRELIAAGTIGRVITVQADELVGWLVTSLMNRSSWRRLTAHSGGSMLEKCCHDMDILNWLIGSRPAALHSFGGRQILGPNSLLPDTCDVCSHATDCTYYQKPRRAAHEDAGEDILHQFISEDNRCIYNLDKDINDIQTVSIQYENGALANFLLSFHVAGPRAGRSICITGTRGNLWGHIDELKLQHFDNATGKVTVHDTRGDGSGHGGGDQRHALEFARMLREPNYRPAQDAYSGYVSAVMCFAADRAVREARRVNFRYTTGGFIELD